MKDEVPDVLEAATSDTATMGAGRKLLVSVANCLCGIDYRSIDKAWLDRKLATEV
jgi:hypothetical protein